MKFYQCTMEKNEGEVKSFLTSWIPEKFANKGRVLELKCRETGTWSNGWIVKSVGSFQRDKTEVIQRSQDYKTMKRVTDI